MTKEELAAIVAELDADLKKGAADAEVELKKALPPPKDDSSSPADESASANAEASEAPEAPPADAAPEGAEAPASEPDQAPVDPAAQGEAQLTPEALQAEYAQLSPEELDMHLQAAMAAKEALAASGPAAPAAAPMAPPMAPPAPAAPAMGMGKEELKINSENTGGKISKSQQDLTDLIKSQSEDIEILTKAVKTILETPIRKSITSISDVQPAKEVKEMGRREVDNFIKENAHKMTKSERDLWLGFTDNRVPASKLAPMLERLSNTK